MSCRMKNFNYDILTLIELVKKKPIIWDKTNEEYRNKIKKKNAWNEIYMCLEHTFEKMHISEKNETGAMISSKWQNLRDAFVRSIKTNTGQSFGKKYIYYEQLSFLLKTLRKDYSEMSMSSQEYNLNEFRLNHEVLSPKITHEVTPPRIRSLLKVRRNRKKSVTKMRMSSEEYYNSNEFQLNHEISPPEITLEVSPVRIKHEVSPSRMNSEVEIRRNSKNSDTEIDNTVMNYWKEELQHDEDEEFVSDREMSSPETHSEIKLERNKRKFNTEIDIGVVNYLRPSPLDEDEAFFASISPSLKRMTESEKIDFKIGVLQLIQEQKKQCMYSKSKHKGKEKKCNNCTSGNSPTC